MSANDYYNSGKPQEHQGGYYPPPQGPPPGGQGGYYPQAPQQSYQGGPPQGYPQQYPQQGYPQQGYQPQPGPQTVYVQQTPDKSSGSGGCMACLAGMCLCCCAEELCECLF